MRCALTEMRNAAGTLGMPPAFVGFVGVMILMVDAILALTLFLFPSAP